MLDETVQVQEVGEAWRLGGDLVLEFPQLVLAQQFGTDRRVRAAARDRHQLGRRSARVPARGVGEGAGPGNPFLLKLKDSVVLVGHGAVGPVGDR
jgi:hypothetical protein